MEHISRLSGRRPGRSLPAQAQAARQQRVGDLMSPVESVISVTAPLRDVAARVRGLDPAVLVLGLSQQPLGLITEATLHAAIAAHPQRWQRRRCACLIGPEPAALRAEDPLMEVLVRYRTAGAQPLLVLDGEQAAGILYPDPVFSWCLTQPSEVFDALGLVRQPRRGAPAPPVDYCEPWSA